MHLTKAQVASLVPARDASDYSRVVLTPPAGSGWDARWAAVVARRPDGLLLACPLDDAIAAGLAVPVEPFGLATEIEVPSRSEEDPDLEAEPLLRLLLVDLISRGYSLLRARPAKNSEVLDFASASVDELLDAAPLVYPLGAALAMAAEAWVNGLPDSGGMDAFFSAGEADGEAALRLGARRARGRGAGEAGSSSSGVAATVVAALQGQFSAIEARLASLEAAGAAAAAASGSAGDPRLLH